MEYKAIAVDCDEFFSSFSLCNTPPDWQEAGQSLRWENGSTGVAVLDLDPGMTYQIGFVARYAHDDKKPEWIESRAGKNWYEVVLVERNRQWTPGQQKLEVFRLPENETNDPMNA